MYSFWKLLSGNQHNGLPRVKLWSVWIKLGRKVWPWNKNHYKTGRLQSISFSVVSWAAAANRTKPASQACSNRSHPEHSHYRRVTSNSKHDINVIYSGIVTVKIESTAASLPNIHCRPQDYWTSSSKAIRSASKPQALNRDQGIKRLYRK